MINLSTQHRTLLAGLAATFVLSACGANRGEVVHADLGAASSPASTTTTTTTATAGGGGQTLQPGRTLQVQSSLRIAPGTYVCPPVTGEGGARGAAGVILIEGLSDVTLDLRGVTLLGAPPGTPRDALAGTGILLRRCDGVTVRGGKLGGFKACILAEDCHDVVIEDVTFDGWYSDRLRSTVQAEDPLDWLWPHENDDGQWVARYGAAIALVDCSNPVVRGSRGRHGQNGILLVRSGGAAIHDNDFSFLSGWGIALYRASKNVVDHNRFDYCVRGYSHGRYWRGQDSAGILVFERSSDNVFAYNSATHSGDGLFLYGGQDLVEGRAWERGENAPGGCDRNVIWRNDFSYAVANSVEATFSRDNLVLENRMVGSHQHGVWGGYSTGLVVVKNVIEDTLGGAVSIEHGQECVIAHNELARNEVGVELWWDEDPDLVGGPFGQHMDTSSRDHHLEQNRFEDNVQDLVFKHTTGIALTGNRFVPGEHERILKVSGLTDQARPDQRLDLRSWLDGVDGARASGFVEQTSLVRPTEELPRGLARALAFEPPKLPGKVDPRREPGDDEGTDGGLATIVVGEWGPWDREGGEPRPQPRRVGGVLVDARWDAVWFAWTAASDPRGDLDAWRARRFQPLVRKNVDNFASPWSDDDVRGVVGNERFGLIARTELVTETDRTYRLAVLSDDGVRVFLDGRVVLENWTWHPPTRDEVELEIPRGRHALEVEYFQLDGAAALAVDLTVVDPS